MSHFTFSFINNDDYVRFGDIIDCLSEVFRTENELMRIEGLIEGAIGKRAISKEALMQTQPDTTSKEEAHILTIEEVQSYLSKDNCDKPPLWVQWATDSVVGGWVLSHTVEDLMWRYEEVYQVHWILWSRKPTDTQREAVKWDD